MNNVETKNDKDNNFEKNIGFIEKKGDIQSVRSSQDLVIVVDATGETYSQDTLYCYVAEGGDVGEALKDAYLSFKSKENAEKVKVIFKHKGIKIVFGREDKYKDISQVLKFIPALSEGNEVRNGNGVTV